MSCFKLNKNRPVKMVSLHENSNWKNLSMELYQLCITIIFALSHFGPLVSVGDHRVQNDPVTGGLVFVKMKYALKSSPDLLGSVS